VRRRRESRHALGLALVFSLLLGVWFPGAEGARAQESANDLRRQQAGLSARSHSALLSLYALDSRLAQAQTELARVRDRTEALRRELRNVRQEAAIVEGNLRASQHLLGDRLRTLYAEGEPDAIAVLLGAESLDEAVTRLDELERSARMGAQAATDARAGRARLRALAAKLSAQLRQVQALEARAEQTAAALTSSRLQRVAYIASLARQRRLNTRQIEALDARARSVVQRAQAMQAQSIAAAPVTTSPFVTGTRTVTVSATGYSLPGRTATGLPVGLGVVAVDPSVIPLGTRMTIPGYGEGVAADTGSSVQGYEIDLWFPTMAAALAWGRRTVTISLH
jgi:3D (Asp-Asp-Asp) domain-containing protein/peptidoglycan hydrolase CwlO-like protein